MPYTDVYNICKKATDKSISEEAADKVVDKLKSVNNTVKDEVKDAVDTNKRNKQIDLFKKYRAFRHPSWPVTTRKPN